MGHRERIRAQLFGLLATAVGFLALVFLLHSMTHRSGAPPEEQVQKQTRLALAPPPPPPPPKKAKRKPKKRRDQSARSPRRAPRVGNALGGIASDLFEGQEGLGSDGTEAFLDGASDAVMTSDTVDQKPRLKKQVPVDIPAKARRKGIGGELLFRLLISATGRVKEIKLISARPAGVFEEAAEMAVRQFIFEPARYQGKPRAVWETLPLHFQAR